MLKNIKVLSAFSDGFSVQAVTNEWQNPEEVKPC